MSPIQPNSFEKALRACSTPNAENQQSIKQAPSNEFISSIQTSLYGIEHKLEILLETSRINAQTTLETCNNTKLSELTTDNLVSLAKNLGVEVSKKIVHNTERLY
ncbi:6705_t:CDS:1 [Ambispora gerdemannii]|uniref:6705_t:CDS:1 n=1 Tax=Ambispora gerdemannii TaxID=144530 RepID=A0A9N9GUU8_9GLOM|nr:6705_t:CDS:1 [Ambispora gerdemannii]